MHQYKSASANKHHRYCRSAADFFLPLAALQLFLHVQKRVECLLFHPFCPEKSAHFPKAFPVKPFRQLLCNQTARVFSCPQSADSVADRSKYELLFACTNSLQRKRILIYLAKISFIPIPRRDIRHPSSRLSPKTGTMIAL